MAPTPWVPRSCLKLSGVRYPGQDSARGTALWAVARQAEGTVGRVGALAQARSSPQVLDIRRRLRALTARPSP